MLLSESDIQSIKLTIALACIVTLILLLICIPFAWWLAKSESRWKNIVSIFVSMPLILPPTVLGFYLLLAMGPNGPLGWLMQTLEFKPLPFTFSGLVIASIFYSLPFMVQPIQKAFEAVGQRPLDLAATLRASPLDTFFNVVLPLSKPGIVSGCIMTFAHTLGEFGVVLMIGGNLPGVTRVASMQIYDHVERMDYSEAHILSFVLLVFSLVTLGFLQVWTNPKKG